MYIIVYLCTHVIWVWFLDHLVLNVSSGVSVVSVDSILVREGKNMHAAVLAILFNSHDNK